MTEQNNPLIENWKIIEWHGKCVLNGKLLNDSRFEPNTFVITSPIVSISVDENNRGVAITRNTVYNLGFCVDDTYLDIFKGEQQFTKADMKDGMRFVLRNGDVHYWCEDFDCPMVDDIDVYDKELITNELINSHGDTHLDIMEVYALGELVWKRDEESEEQKKLKEIYSAIENLQEEAKAIVERK